MLRKIAIAFLLVIGLCSGVGCAADAGFESGELAAARSRFAALGWAKYQYTFERTGFAPNRDGVVTVFVENGNVVRVVAAATGQPLPAAQAAAYSTIDGLYTEVERRISTPDVRVDADFDPRGIPVRAYFDAGEEGDGFEVRAASERN